MAGKAQGNKNFTSAEFVSYTLSKEQKAELKGTAFTFDELDSQVSRLVEDGYKITFREDAFNACKACWLVPDGPKHVNAGMILSGRGSTALKALKQAMFIHYQIFDELWENWRDASNSEDMED